MGLVSLLKNAVICAVLVWPLGRGQSFGIPAEGRQPVLLFDRKAEAGIKERIKQDAAFRGVHELILQTANQILSEAPVFFELKGKRLLDKATKARKRIFYLSYAWRMTGKAEYAGRARKEMLALAGFKDWNPSHFLDVAEITMALAIGYDWIYPSLDAETRSLIEKAIIEKGLSVSFESENSWWADKDSNWNSVCNGGLVFGALVTRHVNRELSNRVIRRAQASAKLVLSAYAPDGAYPEGYTYWSYGTTFLVMLLEGLGTAQGKPFDLTPYPGFLKTASYLQHMVGPTGMNFNYSDGVPKSAINPAMFWFASRLKKPGLLKSEHAFMVSLKNMTWIAELPLVLVWGHALDLKGMERPTDLNYVGHGKNPVAMFRTDWTDHAFYIALKAGSPSVSHGHMDAGSFVLEAAGERWAVDAGKQDYNGLESAGMDIWSFKQNSDRWKVFRNNNFSHNTLTLDGQLQYVQGFSDIISVTSGASLTGAVADLSKIYPYVALSIKRGVAISGKNGAVVRDELVTRSGKPVNLQWTMLTPAVVRLISPQRAELTLNGKRLFMTVAGTGTPKLVTWPATVPAKFDEPLEGHNFVGVKMTLPAGSNVFINMFFSTAEKADASSAGIPSLKDWKP